MRAFHAPDRQVGTTSDLVVGHVGVPAAPTVDGADEQGGRPIFEDLRGDGAGRTEREELAAVVQLARTHPLQFATRGHVDRVDSSEIEHQVPRPIGSGQVGRLLEQWRGVGVEHPT